MSEQSSSVQLAATKARTAALFRFCQRATLLGSNTADAARAVHTFASLLEDTLERSRTPPLESIERAIDRYYRDYLQAMDLEVRA